MSPCSIDRVFINNVGKQGNRVNVDFFRVGMLSADVIKISSLKENFSLNSSLSKSSI